MTTDETTSPWLYVTLGLLLAAFGCPAYFAQQAYDAPLWLGPLLLFAAVTFLSIGAISIGVANGIARASQARQRGEVTDRTEVLS